MRVLDVAGRAGRRREHLLANAFGQIRGVGPAAKRQGKHERHRAHIEHRCGAKPRSAVRAGMVAISDAEDEAYAASSDLPIELVKTGTVFGGSASIPVKT